MWNDSHAHLGDCDDNRLDEYIVEAREYGVHGVINTATSLMSSNNVVRQSTRHAGLFASIGISPFDVTDDLKNEFPAFAELAKNPRVVAIGETGLDSTNTSYPPVALQREFFEKHLELASTTGLPVVVHSRGCEQQVLDICLSFGMRTVVFHCYTGEIETLKRIINAGYAVSFSGIITFKNSPLSPLVSYAPLSQMLIETDSPYLAPEPKRGKRNRPAWVAYVGKAVSAIKNVDEEECSRSLDESFSRVFGTNIVSK